MEEEEGEEKEEVEEEEEKEEKEEEEEEEEEKEEEAQTFLISSSSCSLLEIENETISCEAKRSHVRQNDLVR